MRRRGSKRDGFSTACLNKFRLNSSFLLVNKSLGFFRFRMLQEFSKLFNKSLLTIKLMSRDLIAFSMQRETLTSELKIDSAACIILLTEKKLNS